MPARKFAALVSMLFACGVLLTLASYAVTR